MGNSLVTPAAIESVLTLIVEGHLMYTAAKSLNLPLSSLYRAFKRDPDLWEQYKRARELGANAIAEQAVDIADNDLDAKRARNRVMVRQWLAGKLDPKTYGDKLDLTVTHTVDLSGALAEARSRVRPVCDQAQVIEVEVIESKRGNASGAGDSESAAPPAEPDIFR